MLLTRQGDYAIRTISYLAARPGMLIPTKEIAQHQEIPEKYLIKIIQTLAKAGLVNTLRGSGGGVRLNKEPTKITLKEVVETIEGPILLNQCLSKPGACDRSAGCSSHVIWSKLQHMISNELEAITFDKLI